MKTNKLFLALTDVEDVYIDISREVAIKSLRQRIFRKWLAVAACVALLLAATGYSMYGIYGAADVSSKIVFPDENEKVECKNDPTNGQLSGLPVTYEDIIKEADIIVVADVKADYDGAPEDSIFGLKIAEVTVIEALKGEASVGSILFVRDHAYRIENGSYGTGDGGLLLETGNRVLLFLSDDFGQSYTAFDATEHTLYSVWGYGKYFLDRDGKYHLSASYGDHYMSEYYLRTHIEYAPKTIDDYRELIRSVESAQIVLPEIVYPGENEKIEYENGPLIG